jgi:preprotein translocase subunit SecD
MPDYSRTEFATQLTTASTVTSSTVSSWVTARFNILSSVIVGLTGVVVLITPTPASLAGFALTFALSISNDLLFVVHRWTQLQHALVAVSEQLLIPGRWLDH